MLQQVGHYRIDAPLGEGGMGVVYAAHDLKLDRPVALKMMREPTEERARERLWREARAAASVNHPNICQVYEVGEHQGELYLAMELLEGESLEARIGRGPLPRREAVQVTLGILTALEALHRRDIVHRDLKPSNVFLTPHGVKLMDFGLALPLWLAEATADVRLTQPGTAVGTPRYMAPEQWAGEPIGPAADLFAVGALLFEMLTGQPAFAGTTSVAVYHAILYEHPPVLTGGGGDLLALDRVVQRALAKRPAERYDSAAAMAAELRLALAQLDTGEQAPVRAMTRLIVLPFRLLRPDPELDFLSFGLADAIATSLTGFESLVVRASATAARFTAETPSFEVLATQAAVDIVLLGTLLRAGSQVRVAAQLVEVPAGTVVWSKTAQVHLQDIFQLQDDLTQQIVESLALPLTSREHRRMQRDVPASPRAYEYYLRANHLGCNVSSTSVLAAARDLYRTCLEEDSNFAPAWARIARIYRVMAKYGHEDVEENIRLAEAAFQRALDINPELSLAHNLYTYFELEELGQPQAAMLRLLERVRARSADPDLFAGLVVALRFCGLLDASLAADRCARRLDPGIQTSVLYTHWLLGDLERVVQLDREDIPTLKCAALALLGREAEAIDILRSYEGRTLQGVERAALRALRASLEGNAAETRAMAAEMRRSRFRDPEGILFLGRNLAHAGALPEALETLDFCVQHGFLCPACLARDPWLDSVRFSPEFGPILHRAEAGHREAARTFAAAGGERLLGMTTT